MRKIGFFALLLLLVACQPARAGQDTPPAPLKVAVSSSLSWLEPDLADCAAGTGLAVQHVETVAAGDGITLRLGVPEDESYAAVLGEEELAIIVHPDNPLAELPLDIVRNIFAGREKNWPDQSEIQVWSLPRTGDLSTALLAAGFSIQNAGLAPTPQAMREVVAANPAAIGYLPARWVDGSVRALTIDGFAVRLPILTISAQEPQGEARALLVCLQEKIEP